MAPDCPAGPDLRLLPVVAMHVHIHRPVICVICKAEMSQYPNSEGWFRCHICGAKRRLE